jgi:tRNA 5-methylaminomethyl-2-thiouridine biosynthesis bifunctional protein
MSTDAGPVTAARISFDAEGIPRAADFDDVYHSADGGPAQAHHVFIGGNDLPMRWRARRQFAILETGFGLGLNFLCTVRAFLDDPHAPQRLHYVAVEKHPASASDLERAHAPWLGIAEPAAALRRAWPPMLQGFHRLTFAEGRIALTLLFGDAVPMLSELDSERFDAFYLDGFAPAKNPQMWSPGVFAQIARLSRPGATAATWSIAAVVRSGLQSAGFGIERRRGFGHKRDMLTARRPGVPDRDAVHGERRAIVIGAGLAGCWTAHALVSRGWTVDLIERNHAPAQEASGNPVGALLPALNLADNANARLGRAAFLYASRAMTTAALSPQTFERCGLLHLALERESTLQAAASSKLRSRPAQRERMREILRRHRFPAEYVRWVEQDEATELAGMPVGSDGWFIPAGGWVCPQALCEALLNRCGSSLRAYYGTHVRRIEHGANGWRIVDDTGHIAAEAPVAIIAAAYEAAALMPHALPRLISVRGQITYLPSGQGGNLRCAVCGDGYAAPLPDGSLCIGATFEPGSTAFDMRADDHAQNLRRAQRMLPGVGGNATVHSLQGRVGLRTATADRLPACGEVALPSGATDTALGLHVFAGLGARGLIWAPLGAQILAARLEREPNPVEASLIDAMHPGRDVHHGT